MLDAIIGAALDAEPKNRIRSVAKFKDAMDIWFDCVRNGTTENISLVYPIIGDGTFYHDGIQYFDEEEYAEAPDGGAIITKKELIKQSREIEPVEEKKEPDQIAEISKLMKRTQESKSLKLDYYEKKEDNAQKSKRIKFALSMVFFFLVGAAIFLAANFEQVRLLLSGKG